MQTLRISLLLTTALVAALPAGAEDATALDEITVSANLEATGTDRTGATVTVVTADALAQAGDTRVADYLSRLPGISVNSSGPIGTTASLYLRGAPAQYIPVLVDGIEVGDPAATQGAYDFGTLSTADVSRIEVLEGSSSALYGSQAVAGVINITTKRATKLGTEQSVAAEYGQYATRKFSYSVATKTENAEAALTYSHISTHGFSARDENDGNYEADGYRANRLSFFGQYTFANGLTLGANGFAEKSWGEFDDYEGDVAGTPGNDFTTRDSKGARVFADFVTGTVANTLEATWFDSDRQSCSNGWCDPFDGTRTKFGYQGATDLGATARLAFGADTTKEKSAGASTRTNGVFGELNWAAAEKLDLTFSLRHDTHSDFGSFTSGRIAAVYRLQDDLLLRASLGNGFRAPSLYELYSVYGDPDLKREDSQSADIGIEKRWGETASLRATAFYLDAKNLIGWDYAATACGQPWGCYAQVDGHSRRSGLELAGHYRVSPRLDLAAAYTYTDNSVSTGWAAVAHHDLTVTATGEITEALSGDMSVHYVADRPDGMEDYAVVNASLSYDFGEGRTAYLRVENLFDKEYQTNKGYGTSDRAFYVGLRASF